MKETAENAHYTRKNILLSAKAEFLDKGFMNASLRTIAANAGVTTGALYRHFHDKDDIFCALVDDVVAEIDKSISCADVSHHKKLDDIFGKEHQVLEREEFQYVISMIYEKEDIFELLISKSAGSTHENFLDDVSDKYSAECIKLVKWMKKNNFLVKELDDMTVHMLTSNVVSLFAEIVLHHIPRQKTDKIFENIAKFYQIGWSAFYCPSAAT